MAASSPLSRSLHEPLIASAYEPLPPSHLYPAVRLSPPPPAEFLFNFSRSAFDDIAKRNHPLFHRTNTPLSIQRPVAVRADGDVQDQLRAMHAAERAEVERARLRAARADHAEAIAAVRSTATSQSAAAAHVADELCGGPSQRFVRHLVVATDDVVDLAVRYRTSVEAIRRHNRRVVFDYLDNVMGEFILVPVADDFELACASSSSRSNNDDELLIPGCGGLSKAELEAQSQRNRHFFAVRSFCNQANRGILDVASQCSELEAKFYLQENNFNVAAALAAYRDDVEWEKAEKTKSVSAAKTSKNYSQIVRDIAETKALRMRAAVADASERAQIERELAARKQRRNEIRRRLEEAKLMRAVNPSPPPAPVRVYRNVGEGYALHAYTNAVLN